MTIGIIPNVWQPKEVVPPGGSDDTLIKTESATTTAGLAKRGVLGIIYEDLTVDTAQFTDRVLGEFTLGALHPHTTVVVAGRAEPPGLRLFTCRIERFNIRLGQWFRYGNTDGRWNSEVAGGSYKWAFAIYLNGLGGIPRMAGHKYAQLIGWKEPTGVPKPGQQVMFQDDSTNYEEFWVGENAFPENRPDHQLRIRMLVDTGDFNITTSFRQAFVETTLRE